MEKFLNKDQNDHGKQDRHDLRPSPSNGGVNIGALQEIQTAQQQQQQQQHSHQVIQQVENSEALQKAQTSQQQHPQVFHIVENIGALGQDVESNKGAQFQQSIQVVRLGPNTPVDGAQARAVFVVNDSFENGKSLASKLNFSLMLFSSDKIITHALLK